MLNISDPEAERRVRAVLRRGYTDLGLEVPPELRLSDEETAEAVRRAWQATRPILVKLAAAWAQLGREMAKASEALAPLAPLLNPGQKMQAASDRDQP